MTTYKSLPKEILSIIFNSIDSLAALSACRLVCRAWDDPAETAMLSKPIEIHHQDRVIKLVDHLAKKPEKGRHIKHLMVPALADNDIVDALLQLAFTPNIEELNGNVFTNLRMSHFLETMTKIANQSREEFKKLKSIPTSHVLNDSYSKALLTFKSTLQHIELWVKNNTDSQDLIHRLGEFKSLNALDLYGEIDNIVDLETILKGCCNLQALYLNMEDLEALEKNGREMDKDQLILWAKENVQQVASVKTLDITALGFPSFIEYLMFKYPNTESFNFNIFGLELPFEVDDLVSLNIDRIINALKHLKQYSLDYKIPPRDDLSTVCKAARGDCNVLSLQYHEFGSLDDMSMHLKVKTLRDASRMANFIVEIPTIASLYNHVNLISQTGIPLDRLEIDFLNHSVPRDSCLYAGQLSQFIEEMVFLNILKKFPEIKEIKVIAHYINEDDGVFRRGFKTSLRSLEICSAWVYQNAFYDIGGVCPELKVLKLVNCHVAFPSIGDRIFHIYMCHISFDQFIFASLPIRYLMPDNYLGDNHCAYEYFEETLKEVLLVWSEQFYLWLSIKQAEKKIYFKTNAAPNAAAKPISKSQFESRPKESVVLHLSCFSIKTLMIFVGQSFLTVSEAIIHRALNSPLSYAFEDYDVIEYKVETGGEDEEW
ncbi:hypothetical protein BD408DRAFT_415013 [Parasitella parasitica]|nr:hypothetical protein BD408DRAFT_415013 [Parasitella parasitica]